MSPAGFETTIPASEWPQTHTLDRAATGIGEFLLTAEAINVEHEDKNLFLIVNPNVATFIFMEFNRTWEIDREFLTCKTKYQQYLRLSQR